jgi:hypothetical protein
MMTDGQMWQRKGREGTLWLAADAGWQLLADAGWQLLAGSWRPMLAGSCWLAAGG